MPMPLFLQAIIGWLRAGYPDGVPSVDYIPLFALLGSQLTEVEVMQIADELAKDSDPQSAEAIKKAIEDVMGMEPNEHDVARVRRGLRPAAGRWPGPTRSAAD